MKNIRTSNSTTSSTRSTGAKPVNRPIKGMKWQAMNGADVRQLTWFRGCTSPRREEGDGTRAAYLLEGRESGAASRNAEVTSGNPRSEPVANGSNRKASLA